MNKFFIISLLSLLVIGCSDGDKLPKDVIPEKRMREVIWDMTRTGEFLNGFVFNKDSSIDKLAESHRWYDKIYQLHKISKEQFDKSYAYYQNHPLLMKVVLDSLAKRQMASRSFGFDKSPVKDSIINRLDSVKRKDSLRRVIDKPRKKLIRPRKSLYKSVLSSLRYMQGC